MDETERIPARWRAELLRASGKFDAIAGILRDAPGYTLSTIAALFKTPRQCNLCQMAGLDADDVPDCSNCPVTGFGRFPGFACTDEGFSYVAEKTGSQLSGRVDTIMSRFLTAIIRKDYDLALKAAVAISLGLRHVAETGSIRDLPSSISF